MKWSLVVSSYVVGCARARGVDRRRRVRWSLVSDSRWDRVVRLNHLIAIIVSGG